MRSTLIVIFGFIVLFTSCKNEGKPANNDKIVQEVTVSDTLELTFNNGNKWLVNAETHEGVKNMDSIMADFTSEGSENYKQLGEELSKQTGYIIKNCTMTGEPHNQLHVVLVPMLDEISVLRESNNPIQLKAAFANLDQLIQTYFKHFNL